MAKNKLHKYERVKQLPNVIFSERGKSEPPLTYPWYDTRWKGAKKILELGCGKGEHTLAFAAADPGNFCVGIDYKSHRICVGAEKAVADCLENVYFLRVKIEQLMEYFLENSIHEIWLTFPDPQPKKRTIKSRLSAAPFLDMYAALLVPGGTVNLKTDSDLFYDYTMESVEQWGGRIISFSNDIYGSVGGVPEACGAVSTFEKKAVSKGSSIKYIQFELN